MKGVCIIIPLGMYGIRRKTVWNQRVCAVWNQCEALYGIKPTGYTLCVMPYATSSQFHATRFWRVDAIPTRLRRLG